jgi:outer membrane protein assembly factor BamD (BamD/ComL family)
MKKHTQIFSLLLFGLLLLPNVLSGQSTERAFRNIEKGEYDKALELLKKLKAENSTDVNTNVGLAVVFSADSFPGHNYFLAWQHAILAEQNFSNLIEKDKETLNEFLFNMEIHKSSFPVKQKFDNLYKVIENKLIKYVREEKDLAMVNDFITRFPNSKFYENVLHIRNYLEFGKALELNTIDGFEQFMRQFPDAAQVPQAIELRDKLAFNLAKNAGSIDAINKFIKDYPNAPQVEEALRLRNELAFNIAKKANTIEALAAFIKDYPDAVQAPAALKLKRQLVYEKAKKVNSFEAYTDFIRNYPEGEQFVDVFNLRANALADRYLSTASLEVAGKISWSRAFDFSGNNDIPGGVALGPQGEVICSGSSSAGESGFQEAWIMKLSPDGKLIWNKPYPANQGSHASILQLSKTGDIYFGGYSILDISQGLIQGWIGKVNTEGFRYYDRTISSMDVNNFLLLNDKEMLLAGYNLDSAGQPKYWLGLCRENGKNIWTRNYTSNGMVHGIASGPAGEIFMAGGRWNMKADHAGYLVMEYFPENNDSVIAVSLTPAGELVLAGITRTGYLKSIRLNKAGKKTTEKTFSEIQNFQMSAHRQGPSGEIWLGGSQGGKISILKISETGLLTRELSLSGDSDMSLADFIPVPGGGFLLLFTDRSADTGSDVVLMKITP